MSFYNYIQINGLKYNNKDIFYKKVFENNNENNNFTPFLI